MEKEILLVEDNPDDVELTRIAFAEANIGNPLRVAHDGAQALSYLDECARSGRFPALVLLDLNLPKVNGREVLQTIRGNRTMHGLPVVMLMALVTALIMPCSTPLTRRSVLPTSRKPLPLPKPIED